MSYLEEIGQKACAKVCITDIVYGEKDKALQAVADAFLQESRK